MIFFREVVLYYKFDSKCGVELLLILGLINELMFRIKIMDRYDIVGKKE